MSQPLHTFPQFRKLTSNSVGVVDDATNLFNVRQWLAEEVLRQQKIANDATRAAASARNRAGPQPLATGGFGQLGFEVPAMPRVIGRALAGTVLQVGGRERVLHFRIELEQQYQGGTTFTVATDIAEETFRTQVRAGYASFLIGY